MGKNRHGNKLTPSSIDDVALAVTVEARFIDLCGTYRRLRGVDLVPPPDMDSDLMRWRQMRVRHKCDRCGSGVIAMQEDGIPALHKGMPFCGNCRKGRGDFRHTDAEIRSVRNVAEWTVIVNARLRDQKVDVDSPVNWAN